MVISGKPNFSNPKNPISVWWTSKADIVKLERFKELVDKLWEKNHKLESIHYSSHHRCLTKNLCNLSYQQIVNTLN